MQATLEQETQDVSSTAHANPGVTTSPATANVDATLLARLLRSSAGWIVVALLLAIQWGLFYQFALREVVWAYPTNHDQNVYLMMSYETYEQILEKGLGPGLLSGLNKPIANGVMIHLQTSLLFLVIGPSRLSALTLNFAYFALFQCILVATLRWLTGRWSIALLGMGLLLTAITPFYFAGGLMDFRIDFIAFCLFGIFTCLVIRSAIFMSWRWSAAIGVVAALAVLFRFITMAYLAAILGLIFIFCCVRLWRHRRDPLLRQPIVRQLYGLLIAGSILLLLTAPALWHSRREIQRYYIYGHLMSAESTLRAEEVGVFNLLESIAFYPNSVINDHAGSTFLVLSALVVIMGLVLTRFRSSNDRQEQTLPSLDGAASYFCIAICLLVPYIILTLNVAKSQVVGNVLVPSLLWLVLLSLALPYRKLAKGPVLPVIANAVTALAAIVLCTGLYIHVSMLGRHGQLSERRADVEQILELHDLVFQYTQSFGLSDPLISVDRITDYFDAEIMKTVMYERHGIFFHGHKGLGTSLFAVTPEKAIETAKNSDFLVLSVPRKPEKPFYPFDIAMQAIRPSLLNICNVNLVPVRHFDIYDRDVILCVRPQLKVSAESDGWVSTDGMTLSGPSSLLKIRPTIELLGKSSFDYLTKVPSITATVRIPDQAPTRVSATFQRVPSSLQDYRIIINVDPRDIPADTDISIHLSFDTYFVPKDNGLGEDARQLVIRSPNQITLLPVQ